MVWKLSQIARYFSLSAAKIFHNKRKQASKAG